MSLPASAKLRVMLTISAGFTQEMAADVVAATPEAEFVLAEDNLEAILAAVEGINGMVNVPRHLFSDEVLEKAGDSLCWIHIGGAGVEEFIIPSLVESDIVLTNGRAIQGPEVADHALALLLALTRNLHFHLLGKTDQQMKRPIELRGKRGVVIGGGGLGMLIVERAAAFGMTLDVVDPNYMQMLSIIDRQYTPDQYLEPFPDADVVFMAAPYTFVEGKMKSERMMDDAAFGAMKQDAYFINISRGKIVDTDALTGAMQLGRLAGAGLDVTDPEPLPEDHPLWAMDNVIITPHIAGLSEHNRRRSFDLIKKNLDRFSRGLPLMNVVNKRLGY